MTVLGALCWQLLARSARNALGKPGLTLGALAELGSQEIAPSFPFASGVCPVCEFEDHSDNSEHARAAGVCLPQDGVCSG